MIALTWMKLPLLYLYKGKAIMFRISFQNCSIRVPFLESILKKREEYLRIAWILSISMSFCILPCPCARGSKGYNYPHGKKEDCPRRYVEKDRRPRH